MMRKCINSEFSDYTVLAIVHSFEGVAEDMDKLVILDKGKVIRMGPPGEILIDGRLPSVD